MVSLLAHPFRVTSQGTAATVEQGSDEQLQQQLVVLIGTVQSERQMVPDFGLIDPVWRGIWVEDIQAGCDLYGPAVTVSDVDTTTVDDVTVVRGVSWERT